MQRIGHKKSTYAEPFLRHPRSLEYGHLLALTRKHAKLELILKSTDPEAVQEETDSPAVVVVAEPLNVCRGGRGRGRKGVTAKETVQVHDCFMVYLRTS